MAEKSKIQWTDATWNPWHGCEKVSSGCKYCYMFRDKAKYGQNPTNVLKSKTNFESPLKWKEPKLIFTCSWSDFFIEEADEWRKGAWEIIKSTPQHTYQILTKRPERILNHLPLDWGNGYQNVWLGVSVENQKAFEVRVPFLLNSPAVIRFLSVEPLLGPIDLTDFAMGSVLHNPLTGINDLPEIGQMNFRKIDWVIIGGESGNKTGKYLYRPCHILWIEMIVEDCKKSNVPVFIKQLGRFLAEELSLKDTHGGDMSEWPEQLQVREMPKI